MSEVHGVHKDFAEPGCDRPDLRLHALGQTVAGLGQPLADLLACKIEVDILLEDDSDLGETVS